MVGNEKAAPTFPAVNIPGGWKKVPVNPLPDRSAVVLSPVHQAIMSGGGVTHPGVCVGVAVRVRVALAVALGVRVTVGVLVARGVAVGVRVPVAVAVRVEVRVFVAVGVALHLPPFADAIDWISIADNAALKISISFSVNSENPGA